MFPIPSFRIICCKTSELWLGISNFPSGYGRVVLIDISLWEPLGTFCPSVFPSCSPFLFVPITSYTVIATVLFLIAMLCRLHVEHKSRICTFVYSIAAQSAHYAICMAVEKEPCWRKARLPSPKSQIQHTLPPICSAHSTYDWGTAQRKLGGCLGPGSCDFGLLSPTISSISYS